MEASKPAGASAQGGFKAHEPQQPPAAAAGRLGSGNYSDTIVVQSVQRRKVNVAEKERYGRVSPLWKYLIKFEPPLPDGKNVVCKVVENGRSCDHLMRHIPKNGTGTASQHFNRNHKKEYAECMRSSVHSTAAKKQRARALQAPTDERTGGNGPARAESKVSEDGGVASFVRKNVPSTMTPSPRQRLDRKVVIWCVLDGQPWAAVADLGLKTLLAEFAPEFAASPPSLQALDGILFTLYAEVKESVVGILRMLRSQCEKVGYTGGFCNLQLSLTTVANQELCTASVSFLRADSTEVERVSLATRMFSGSPKEADIAKWIESLAEEFFGFIENVTPSDVFLAATVDQGGKVANACESLGIETLLCRAHHINSSVMWMLGIAGSAAKSKNPRMKELVQRCAALAGVFSHSAVDGDALREVQSGLDGAKLKELAKIADDGEAFRTAKGEAEAAAALLQADGDQPVQLPKFDVLNLIRRNDIRWCSQLAFMERLALLEEAVTAYIEKIPQHASHGLSSLEWLAVKETCCVLEYARVVTVGIQGGSEGLFSRSIYLCNELHKILGLDELDVRDFKEVRAANGDITEEERMRPVQEMQEPVQTALKVAVEQLHARKVMDAASDVELIALYLDPRYKSLDGTACGNGDEWGYLVSRAKDALRGLVKEVDAKQGSAGGASTGLAEASETGEDGAGADGPPAKRVRTLFDRREQKRQEAAARARAARRPGKSVLSVSARLAQEMAVYDEMTPYANRHFDVLSFWRETASPRVDKDGNVLDAPKFPLLSSLARVYLSVASTSFQSGRDLSALARTYTKLRRSMDAAKVNKMMFLRLNSGLIPEVRNVATAGLDRGMKSFTAGLDRQRAVQEEGWALAVEAQKEGVGEVVTVAPADCTVL